MQPAEVRIGDARAQFSARTIARDFSVSADTTQLSVSTLSEAIGPDLLVRA